MDSVKQKLCSQFPHLVKDRFDVSSPETPKYNCVAYAAGDTERWWWHFNGHWPSDVAVDGSIESYCHLFANLGYANCDNGDQEAGYEKVAIFCNKGRPKHVAHLGKSGRWVSKLGRYHDITHEVDALDNSVYGEVAMFMRRPFCDQAAET